MSNAIASNWMIFIGFIAAVLITLLFYWLTNRRFQREIDRLTREVDELKRTLNALCSSAVGVDRRMGRLEVGKRELQQRQETIEQHTKSDHPYADAIKVAQKGATASQLVEEFEISRNEADLIVMLHGAKEVS